ncbi:hypothetical protein BIV25_21675 [Streptomyces sp. MUSC 14]|nr:hypothetical protein BIV25_21675 [Streptomyces sp. MUSC 14]
MGASLADDGLTLFRLTVSPRNTRASARSPYQCSKGGSAAHMAAPSCLTRCNASTAKAAPRVAGEQSGLSEHGQRAQQEQLVTVGFRGACRLLGQLPGFLGGAACGSRERGRVQRRSRAGHDV